MTFGNASTIINLIDNYGHDFNLKEELGKGAHLHLTSF